MCPLFFNPASSHQTATLRRVLSQQPKVSLANLGSCLCKSWLQVSHKIFPPWFMCPEAGKMLFVAISHLFLLKIKPELGSGLSGKRWHREFGGKHPLEHHCRSHFPSFAAQEPPRLKCSIWEQGQLPSCSGSYSRAGTRTAIPALVPPAPAGSPALWPPVQVAFSW